MAKDHVHLIKDEIKDQFIKIKIKTWSLTEIERRLKNAEGILYNLGPANTGLREDVIQRIFEIHGIEYS